MQLLEMLFPGMDKFENGGIPSWKDHETPWSIFSDGDGCLIYQIQEIAKSDEAVFVHPTARIGDFVEIEGPCYIGANVEIRHSSYIRRGTWLCEGSVVGHSSEIKNSILLPYSKAPHFNYVGDSILGMSANLGAGTKLSNVRNDRGSIPITLEDGKRIDSGLRKLGAMIGDGSQLGCNVVTNPGTIVLPGVLIRPNVTLSGWED